MNVSEQTIHFENLVRQEWTNDTTIRAWEEWAEEQAIHCQPLTDVLIQHAELSPGLKVLDLAGGVGQPSLSIAQKVGAEGSVVMTDLSEDMLKIAKQRAQKLNLNNLDFEVADAHNLSFSDNSFDRVVSRLGLMYFWDIDRAISEIFRVLKPGGVASFVVWGAPEKSEFFGTILSPFMSRREMPTPPEDAPAPTRFGDTSKLVQAFKNRGFSDVVSVEYCEPLPWPGTPKELFKHFYDMAVPMQAYIDSFSESEQEAALSEIEEGFAKYCDGSFTRVPASFHAVCIRK